MYPEINAIPCGPVFIAFLGGQGISTQHRVRVVVADSDSDCHPLFVSSRDIRLGLPFFSVFLLGLNLFFGLVLLGLKLFFGLVLLGLKPFFRLVLLDLNFFSLVSILLGWTLSLVLFFLV